MARRTSAAISVSISGDQRLSRVLKRVLSGSLCVSTRKPSPDLPRNPSASMTAPLVPLAVACSLGILISSWGFLEPGMMAAIGLGSALLNLKKFARPSLNLIGCCVLWFCAGTLAFLSWSFTAPHEIASFLTEEPRQVLLRGLVVDDPMEFFAPNEPERHVCVVRVHDLRTDQGWRPATGFARVRLVSPRLALAYGDEVLLEGALSQIPAAGNPGQFDWRGALARQRIHALVAVAPFQGVVRLRVHQGRWWLQAIAWLRHRLEQLIREHFSDSHSGLLRSFLLGQRVALDEELKQAFVETGTMHLVVISGFNVGLIAGVLELFLRLIGFPLRVRLVLSGLSLVGYCLLTGMQPPVTRATIMALVVLGALWLDRVINWPNTLAVAALVILGGSPAQLFDPGFQLSFGAVISLLVFTARLRTSCESTLPIQSDWVRRYVGISLASTLAIWIGLWPVLAWYFHLVSPISILANLVLVPLVSLLVSVGTVVLMLGVVVASVVTWTAGSLSWLVDLTVRCVQWCHQIPGGWWPIGRPSWMLIGGYYGLVALSLACRRLRLTVGWVIACWLVGLNVWLWSGVGAHVLASRWLEVTILDVGHGDSLVIRTPSQHTLLVDAGTLEAGRYTVVPFLQFRGWQKLDALILTHPDEDHVGGALPVLRRVHVKRLLTNGATGTTQIAHRVLTLVQARHVPTERLAAGMVFTGMPGVAITVMHPPPGWVPGTPPHSNDNSVVLKLTTGDVSVLLCGDVEEYGVPWLMAWGPALHSTVLKVPHHGSALGRAQRPFLEQVHPSLAVLSVGFLHHLPTKEVMQDLVAVGAKVLLTRRDGAITIRTDGTRLIVHTGRSGR